MQLKLKTEILKTLTSKVVKGMGNNKMLPITEMIGINIKDTKISLLSTDGTNEVEVFATIENPEKITTSLSINGGTFSKLVQKLTTEFVTLNIEDNKLVITGNGNYSFPIPVDEDGNVIVFNTLDLESDETEKVSVNALKESYTCNKESVATTLEEPAYTGFYFDETGSVATNSLKISFVKEPIFKQPALLYSSFVQLFSLLNSEFAEVKQNNSEILISTDNVSIKSSKMIELSDFPIDDIKPFLETEMEHNIRVNKQALLNLLERISIFVTPYDKNGIRVDFTKEGLKVWTIKGESSELLPYVSTNNLVDSTIKIDVTNFKALVSSCPEEEVTIHYGNPNAIKMTFGKVIQIIALQDNN